MSITGDRREGYARIESSGRLSCQVRWKTANDAGDLEARLKAYLERLQKDTRKAKGGFDAAWDLVDGRLSYHYGGSSFGRGSAFFEPNTGRVFFLEVTSSKNDRLTSEFREVLESFEAGQERWALLGLDFWLPATAKVERKTFLAGRTELYLAAKSTKIEAQRWGFGEQLVAKHGLEVWAKAATSMKHADSTVVGDEIALVMTPPVLPATYALVRMQRELNQLTILKVTTRREEWRPTWAWLS